MVIVESSLVSDDMSMTPKCAILADDDAILCHWIISHGPNACFLTILETFHCCQRPVLVDKNGGGQCPATKA